MRPDPFLPSDPFLPEGVSNTILEAMACGLPVVATRVGGNAELVDHGRTGLVVPSDDVPALAQALCQLAQQPQEAARMGAAGRAAVEQRFSLQAMVGAYHRLYDRVLCRPTCRSSSNSSMENGS